MKGFSKLIKCVLYNSEMWTPEGHRGSTGHWTINGKLQIGRLFGQLHLT